jgi:hypothetical protein
MQTLFSKFKNSYMRLFILLISSLCLGFMLITMPKETPTWIIQVIGGIYFLEAISYAMDIYLKIVSNKLKYQQALWDKHFPPNRKELKTEQVKNCSIHDVGCQREQLIAFMEYVQTKQAIHFIAKEELADGYLKSN